MIQVEEKEVCFCLAVKKLSVLLHAINSKHKGDFCSLNCFHSENKFKSHEKVCKNKNFSRILMPSQKDNMLKFNQYMKLDKMTYIIYSDFESLIKIIDGCVNNSENLQHSSWYSMSTIWAFDHMEIKHTLYRGEDCMKKF